MCWIERCDTISTFQNDKVWVNAKKVAKSSGSPSDWIVAIDYYNLQGGKSVTLFSNAREGVTERILGISDDDRVITLNVNDEIELLDYEVVFEAKKKFFYTDKETKITVKELPKGVTHVGESKICFHSA